MNKLRKNPTISSLMVSFLLVGFFSGCATYNPVKAQESKSGSGQNSSQSHSDLFSSEIKPEMIDPDFIRRNSSDGERASGQPQVRMIYLVPSDRVITDSYRAAIADAALHLQDFYQRQMGDGLSFSLHNPIVEVYQTNHTAVWYSTNQPPRDPPDPPSEESEWFFENALADGFAYSGGKFDDPNNRWIYYIDADPACIQSDGQSVGATNGVALLPANDLRGLTKQQNIPPCANDPPDNGGVYRWIGGLGHELGHTFTLEHPPGCDQGACQGGDFAKFSLMYLGYVPYPNTYLLEENITQLRSTGFFSVLDLAPPRPFDFDNDNKADVGVWRPSDTTWYISQSSNGNPFIVRWGLSGDKLVPGDYDGDGEADVAVWRPDTTIWWISQSSNGNHFTVKWGLRDDKPVPGDYDGDGKADVAVWRPSNGVWYVIRSATNTVLEQSWGLSGDLPVPGDYNGDKRTDVAVWRPSTRQWFIYDSYTGNFTAPQFGSVGDKLVPDDYDGDGKTDVAVWRPSDATWYIQKSSNGAVHYQKFGLSTDIPAPGDYDGDGKTDVAVWRSSDRYFYIWRSSTNSLQTALWGLNGDVPVASAFVR